MPQKHEYPYDYNDTDERLTQYVQDGCPDHADAVGLAIAPAATRCRAILHLPAAPGRQPRQQLRPTLAQLLRRTAPASPRALLTLVAQVFSSG